MSASEKSGDGVGRLAGQVAVVTGGASGIGAETVRRFVAEGARVVIADIQDDPGEELAAELGSAAVYQRTDVAEEAEVDAAVDRAVRDFGRLDCVFNNAGFGGAIGPIAEIPVHEFDRTLAVLLRGVFLGIKAAGPILTAQGRGSIINTASVAGLRAGYGPHVYSTAKAAVVALTRSVALELGERGVRVNCICPGGIATPLLWNALGESPTAPDVVRAGLAQLQSIGRSGEPADIAEAAIWLASDASSFVNGHALVVDGGLTGGTRWSLQPEAFRVHRPME